MKAILMENNRTYCLMLHQRCYLGSQSEHRGRGHSGVAELCVFFYLNGSNVCFLNSDTRVAEGVKVFMKL